MFLYLSCLCFLGVFLYVATRQARNPSPAVDVSLESVQRAIATKKKLQERDTRPTSRKSTPSSLPEGQVASKKWIRLDLGIQPDLEKYNPWKEGDEWGLTVVTGKETKRVTVAEMKGMGLEEFQDVPWHCVTGWSTLGLGFRGIPFKAFAAHVAPQEDWTCLLQVGADGYTVPVLREDAESDEHAFIALSDAKGDVLPLEHGGIRFVFPSLFGWKSAKFLSEAHFLSSYRKGFWEELGCHQRGRVQLNERWDPKAEGVWRWLVWMSDQYRVLFGQGVWVFNMGWGSRALGIVSNRLGWLNRKQPQHPKTD